MVSLCHVPMAMEDPGYECKVWRPPTLECAQLCRMHVITDLGFRFLLDFYRTAMDRVLSTVSHVSRTDTLESH